MKTTIFCFFLAFLLNSCAISTIRQGEVGVKRSFGRLQDKVKLPGVYVYSPFFSRVIKVPIQTQNLELNVDLPSKEGLLVSTQISLLYRIKAESVPNIIATIGGVGYEDIIVKTVFRSAIANVSSQFYAKDMHTSQRINIERTVTQKMDSLLSSRGFVVEAVLLKSIKLPAGLTQSIEDKLESEQEAQRMEFVLQKERQEAIRKQIEAEGIRDAQKIISEGLSPIFIQWKSLDVFKTLSSSPNTKIIMTDGRTPMLIGLEGDKK
jgi:prohibitin 1